MKHLIAFILTLWSILYCDGTDTKVIFTSSNLPIVIINTHGQTIVNEPKITADMGIIYNGEGKRNNVTDSINHYNGKIGIEIRGSSSQQFPKKQYGIETRDAAGEDVKVSIFGMPEESDWVLSAQYNDKTLMRDVITYTLSNSMGRYASRTRYCELVLNGEYMGVYMMFEKIKRDKNRVNISKLDATGVTGDAVTGGYIIKIDKLDGSGIDGWYSSFLPWSGAWQKIFYQYHYPKPEDITVEQKTYIRHFVLSFESMFNSNLHLDPEYGYSKYFDVPAMVDFFLTNEMTKNVDAYRLSTFMYKDKDSKNSKIFFGPVWDYNHGFGNSDYYDGAKTDGWQLAFFDTDLKFRDEDFWQPPFWWHKIAKDTSFMNKVKIRWEQLRRKELSLNRIYALIDSVAAHIDEAQQRNFERWPILNSYVWPNAYIGGTYAKEIDYMKKWILYRFIWMDMELVGRILSVPGPLEEVPEGFHMSQNYPNPFNPATTVRFRTQSSGSVSLTVNDILGNTVMTVLKGNLSEGEHTVMVDASGLSSGVYFYRLQSGSYSSTKKMILLK